MKIWGYYTNSGNFKPSNLIFATTIHEIAHSSHIELMTWGIVSYGQVESRLYESWASCVEWYLTDLEYNDIGVANYGNPNFSVDPFNSHKQNWSPPTVGNTTYTPMYIDMVDTYNQSLNEGTPPTNRCPNGGTFDGANCYVGTPPSGESAFIWSNKYYYTPVGASGCPYPGSNYDGANCFVSNIPSNTIGFIWNNKWYYHPAGDSDYPYDQVSGYTMGTLESEVVKNAYGLTSLKQALKQNKPAGMADRHIDVYFNYY